MRVHEPAVRVGEMEALPGLRAQEGRVQGLGVRESAVTTRPDVNPGRGRRRGLPGGAHRGRGGGGVRGSVSRLGCLEVGARQTTVCFERDLGRI